MTPPAPSFDPTDPIAVFRRVEDARRRADWAAVAALADPLTLAAFRRWLLGTSLMLLNGRPLTLEGLPPTASPALRRTLADLAERREAFERTLSDEVAGVGSIEELEALPPAEVFARWLEAHGTAALLARAMARASDQFRQPGPYPTEPLDWLEPLGTVVRDDFAHVVYQRRALPPGADDPTGPVAGESPEEAERRRRLGPGAIEVVTLHRHADGTWRVPAGPWLAQTRASHD